MKKKILAVIIILMILSVFMSACGKNANETDPPLTPNDSTNTDTESNNKPVATTGNEASDMSTYLVNKTHPAPSELAPMNPTKIGDYTLDGRIVDSYNAMIADAKEAGFNLRLYSAYRNYDLQKQLFENKISSYMSTKRLSEEDAEVEAAKIVAPPGTSEHQTGLAIDICTEEVVNKYGSLPEEFENYDEFEWLSSHCAEYGFILRYPKDKVDITGYSYEPWHYRYVGPEAAKKIMSEKICLEEYLEIK